jgi:transcriptional regulator with XRE-family HTH domain
MRSFRLAKYMSQEDLGKHLGVTFQQMQKYEKGTNRLSGSRLIAAAKVLGTSVKQIVGSNGPNSKNNSTGEYLTALSEPPVIALVSMLERLPKRSRRDAARALTDFITAIVRLPPKMTRPAPHTEKASKADADDPTLIERVE